MHAIYSVYALTRYLLESAVIRKYNVVTIYTNVRLSMYLYLTSHRLQYQGLNNNPHPSKSAFLNKLVNSSNQQDQHLHPFHPKYILSPAQPTSPSFPKPSQSNQISPHLHSSSSPKVRGRETAAAPPKNQPLSFYSPVPCSSLPCIGPADGLLLFLLLFLLLLLSLRTQSCGLRVLVVRWRRNLMLALCVVRKERVWMG